MNYYTPADFALYFTGSYIVHPTTGKVVRVLGFGDTGAKLSGGQEVPLESIDWKHVSTSLLGYRSTSGGEVLYHITRRAGRRTTKGITDNAISITVMPLVDKNGNFSKTAVNVPLGQGIAELVFNPEFKTLEEAAELLTTAPSAVGFALSHSWAITVGQYKTEPLLLHFNGRLAAGGSPKHGWKWKSEEAEYVFYNCRGL